MPVVTIALGCGNDNGGVITADNVKRIKAGMALAEVEAILGKGEKKSDKKVVIGRPGTRLATVVTYTLESIELYEWRRKDRGVIVAFDHGRVFSPGATAEIYTWGMEPGPSK